MSNKIKLGMAFCFACWLLLWPVFFVVGMEFHKSKMHDEIELKTEMSEVLIICKKEFPQLSKQKEFDFKGQRYDIIRVADEGDVWKVLAINDEKEKWLEEQADGANDPGNASCGWLKTEMFDKGTGIIHPLPGSIQLTFVKMFNQCDGVCELHAPPPKVFVL